MYSCIKIYYTKKRPDIGAVIIWKPQKEYYKELVMINVF